jgi:hypothetical protein
MNEEYRGGDESYERAAYWCDRCGTPRHYCGHPDVEDAGEEEEGPAVFVDVDPMTFLGRGLAAGMSSHEIVAAYRRELNAIPDEDDAPEA